MKLSIVTFGEKAQAILGHHPFNAKEADRDTFFLIVTDDAATYQEDIDKVLSSENIHGRPVYLVMDLNTDADFARFGGAWTYYNKATDAQTASAMVALIRHHLLEPSMIAFDNRDLLEVCSRGEYLGSICPANGREGLKAVEAPTNATALACGIGSADLSSFTLEQMNHLGRFFENFGEDIQLKWSLSSTPKDEVVILYSCNR